VAQTKGLGFSIDIADAARGVWLGDPMRVRQIVGNLVSNAVKFTRSGEVRVDVARAADGGLACSISDTGVGIAADSVAMLFDKFSQADASTTREFGGTGLGLSISRELARLMGGDIAAESEENKGSVFRVSLPLRWLRPPAERPEPRAAAGPAAATADQDETPARILVAEDNQTNQLVLKAMLEPAGVDLTIVPNGAEAVEAWRSGEFDLVLMDVQMPVMDGVEATRAIRALAAELGRPRIPIIALTANAMNHQVEQYRAAGMDGHVAKPIEAAVLYAALENALADPSASAAA
jgi:CheY-like chemotaxis protein